MLGNKFNSGKKTITSRLSAESSNIQFKNFANSYTTLAFFKLLKYDIKKTNV